MCKEVWEGVTVVTVVTGVAVLMRCVSWWGGVVVMGRRKEDWGGITVDRKCDSHQGGVKGLTNMNII